MCVPVNSVSSEPAIDVFAEAANTVMKPTSATPIISDAAVRAVRFGLRMAFRVASSPLSPRIAQRQAEQRGDRAGEHRAEDDDADERRQRTDADERDLAVRGRRRSAADTGGGDRPTPTTARRTEDRRSGRRSTSRSAAIGAILAARRAGSHADSTVTTHTDGERERRSLPARSTVGPSGMSNPNADISCRSPAATPMPAARPAPEASTPTTQRPR